ncbi:MAG: hypothetical protein A2527_06125 [Candidatus Lambdaproteobacteria bacterium RIFOXYD2_FULL_50_16]|uniref:Uncharacterized protein n=1 Tax=Candidatus Lambdaproteobacteria bacterium RIFOXYD2_FULL_50_16 TaxID=1817772 RepID=A0A1F6G9J2_9PROT|nr:MAG: hypothetical protein A2527_06125 [Candidatus Lambdaproteobacteria bacterium RIFOXYD2_FULL_50_16]
MAIKKLPSCLLASVAETVTCFIVTYWDSIIFFAQMRGFAEEVAKIAGLTTKFIPVRFTYTPPTNKIARIIITIVNNILFNIMT